jgi:hypothetical protein
LSLALWGWLALFALVAIALVVLIAVGIKYLAGGNSSRRTPEAWELDPEAFEPGADERIDGAP